jgi:creatinine amidohydrolase/Fe(II)-dependent formamide hydrolase-like protein
MIEDYFPETINSGPWLTSYTLKTLQRLDSATRLVLPICSIGTPYRELAELGDLVLPPLFHEALDEPLKGRLIQQIQRCFPRHGASLESDPQLEIVELPRRKFTAPPKPEVLAFSVDTAVEEHGPHLPLATDTIQSYAVLRQLETEIDGFALGPPVEYGQLTWGLPFGFSVDLTAALLTEYVCRFVDAMVEWVAPRNIYVVDVHGSIVHRNAIVAGLERSSAANWSFRWLHEPLVEFAADRHDQHAGGVETALVEFINVELVDREWWPVRIGEISEGQMDFRTAVELTPDLSKFVQFVENRSLNGVVGRIENYHKVDANLMFERMMATAREDISRLVTL